MRCRSCKIAYDPAEDPAMFLLIKFWFYNDLFIKKNDGLKALFKLEKNVSIFKVIVGW